MSIKQFEIWVADLSPQMGTEPGKTRPVLVVQSSLLNKQLHPSTVICPITTNVNEKAEVLRVHIPKGVAGCNMASDIMIDQLRAIDNQRLIKKVGDLPAPLAEMVRDNIKLILDLE